MHHMEWPSKEPYTVAKLKKNKEIQFTFAVQFISTIIAVFDIITGVGQGNAFYSIDTFKLIFPASS